MKTLVIAGMLIFSVQSSYSQVDTRKEIIEETKEKLAWALALDSTDELRYENAILANANPKSGKSNLLVGSRIAIIFRCVDQTEVTNLLPKLTTGEVLQYILDECYDIQ